MPATTAELGDGRAQGNAQLSGDSESFRNIASIVADGEVLP